MSDSDKMRAEFEKWADSKCLSLTRINWDDGSVSEYAYTATFDAWQVWQDAYAAGRKALEVAGWKFGNAEDFFKEIIVNFDAAVRDSITIARSLAARSEDYQKAACVLAAEVERLRAELAEAVQTLKRNGWGAE